MKLKLPPRYSELFVLLNQQVRRATIWTKVVDPNYQGGNPDSYHTMEISKNKSGIQDHPLKYLVLLHSVIKINAKLQLSNSGNATLPSTMTS